MTGPVRRGGAMLCAVGVWAAAALPPAAGLPPLATSRAGKCTTADTAAVTLVIDYQQLRGGVDTYCVSGLTTAATGWDVLQAAGVDVAGTVNDGQAFVCRLNGVPGPAQVIPIDGDRDYTEQCVDTPPASAYWSYWSARPGGDWTYSQLGVMSHKVALGGFEGWSFALNATSATVPQPGVKPVPLQVRATPTSRPSSTPSQSSGGTTVPAPAQTRRMPTPEPSGSASPTPSAPGSAATAVQPSQVADLSSQVLPGESTTDSSATIWALVALAGLVAAAGVIVTRRGRGEGGQ